VTSVDRGLLRRIGVILLAIVFLAGGFSRMTVPPALSATAAGINVHPHHFLSSEGSDCAHAMPAAPVKTVPACQHGIDCLSCAAIDIARDVNLVPAQRWLRVSFGHASPRLSGVTQRPELFPPIPRS
jgi:hypothetical protein